MYVEMYIGNQQCINLNYYSGCVQIVFTLVNLYMMFD